MAEVLSQSQIDALLNAALTGDMNLDTPSEDATSKKYRKYDFYSPRKFTKDRLKILSGIFDNYTRIINSRINGLLHTNCEVEVESIEEQRYYEFSNALGEGDVLTLAHLVNKGHRDEMPVLFYLTHQISLSMIDRLIGGEGDVDESLPNDYTLTNLELKLYETVVKDLVSVMGDSWEAYLDLSFEYGRIEVNPLLVQPISLDETVVIVDFNLKFSNTAGRMSICLPGMMLTNLFAEITRDGPSSHVQGDSHSETIFDSLRESNLELVGELCKTEIRLSDVYTLAVGDVIDLNCSKDTPVHINIGGKRWFDGKMGIQNKNLAIKIGATYYKPPERDVEQDGK